MFCDKNYFLLRPFGPKTVQRKKKSKKKEKIKKSKERFGLKKGFVIEFKIAHKESKLLCETHTTDPIILILLEPQKNLTGP